MIVRPYAPPLTVAEYRNLPETGPHYQLIEGDLYMAPAPNRFHQDISRNLEVVLANYCKHSLEFGRFSRLQPTEQKAAKTFEQKAAKATKGLGSTFFFNVSNCSR